MDAVLAPERFRHVVFVDGLPEGIPANQSACAGHLFHGKPVNAQKARQPSPQWDQPEPVPPGCEWQVQFLQWLFDRANLDASAYRPGSLLRRVPACLRGLRVDGPEQAVRLLTRNPALIGPALNTLLIGVTGPFRDRVVFDCLRDRVLPALAARGWSRGARGLRVWSAGCSDGAELYSLAMLLDERSLLACSDLLGTDARIEAIEAAAAGVLAPGAVEAVPPHLRKHCIASEDGVYVSDSLRRRTRWRHADVLASVEPGPWDLILCRNLTMYLQPEAASALYRRLEGEMAPGGFLVLGKAERPHGAERLRPAGPCVYRRATREEILGRPRPAERLR